MDAIELANIVEAADVGMVQGRDGARLALEALPGIVSNGEQGPQNFDRYSAPEPRVGCLVDLSHPARAERVRDAVGSELRASLKPPFHSAFRVHVIT